MRRFNRYYALLAQPGLEHLSYKQGAIGSNPVESTFKKPQGPRLLVVTLSLFNKRALEE